MKARYTTACLVLLLLLSAPAVARLQGGTVAEGKGKGTIKVGREEFDLPAVVVKLKDDGTAEITLVSDISLFFSGSWTRSGNAGEYTIKITGGATPGGVEGGGKIILSADGKSVTLLDMQGESKTRKRLVQVHFEAT